MTAKAAVRRKPAIARHQDRLVAVKRTRANLTKLVYRSMRLEGERITRRQAAKATKAARA
jgi:hypothetical protein